MEMTLTAKIQVFPNREQAKALKMTKRAYRDACNFVSIYVFRTHDLKQLSIHDHCYYDIRSKFGITSQMACSVIRTVIASYKTAKSNGHDWSLVTYKHEFFDLVWHKDYTLKKNGVFSVNSVEGRQKIPFAVKGMERWFEDSVRFGTAKLIFKHGKWFLHIPVTFEAPDEADLEDISNIVGIDLGINFLATAYDSKGKTTFFNGRAIKDRRAHYKELRRQLQSKGTPSSRRRLKSIGQRENRWMQDVNHCVSKALVEKNPVETMFVLEDLTGIRQATEKVRKKDRYCFVSWAFYDLRQKIEYKAQRKGQRVIAVNPAYTSQTCPKCGHVERANRDKKKHIFCCKNCGYRSNDDRIAAMNLHRMGIEHIVGSTVPDARLVEHDLASWGDCQPSRDATSACSDGQVIKQGDLSVDCTCGESQASDPRGRGC